MPEEPHENHDRTDTPGSHPVPRLGTDRHGRRHYYDDQNDRILVVADEVVEHVQDLDGRTLADWRAFVAVRVGWRVYGDEQFARQCGHLADALSVD